MKTTLKLVASVALVLAATASFGQLSTTSKTKHSKKEKTVKEKPGYDNKIAVSDQAQPTEKSSKTPAKKDNGLSTR